MAKVELEGLPQGYFRFVAILTWPPLDDNVARDRMKEYYNALAQEVGIDRTHTQAYNLTGARTFLIIGYAENGVALQKFISSIVFNTPIEAQVYHAVDANEILQCLPQG